MGAQDNTLEIVADQINRKVTLKMVQRDSWGRVTKRTQFTVSERTFNQAMANAAIMVPWKHYAQNVQQGGRDA